MLYSTIMNKQNLWERYVRQISNRLSEITKLFGYKVLYIEGRSWLDEHVNGCRPTLFSSPVKVADFSNLYIFVGRWTSYSIQYWVLRTRDFSALFNLDKYSSPRYTKIIDLFIFIEKNEIYYTLLMYLVNQS